MEKHHTAWLGAHPERSAEWLKAHLAEGFDIHHLDGDHANNDPPNLVLIEHTDHLRLHGRSGNRLKALAKARIGPVASGGRSTSQQIEAKRWSARKRAARTRLLDGLPDL